MEYSYMLPKRAMLSEHTPNIQQRPFKIDSFNVWGVVHDSEFTKHITEVHVKRVLRNVPYNAFQIILEKCKRPAKIQTSTKSNFCPPAYMIWFLLRGKPLSFKYSRHNTKHNKHKSIFSPCLNLAAHFYPLLETLCELCPTMSKIQD